MRTLEVRDVSFTYGKGTPVLEHVSLSVACNERVALSAPSGAGKSTLCKIMAGYLQPDEGDVQISGAGEIRLPLTGGAGSPAVFAGETEGVLRAANTCSSTSSAGPLSRAKTTPDSSPFQGEPKKKRNNLPSPVQLIWQHPELACDPLMRIEAMLREAGSIDEGLLDALGIRRAWLSRFPRELSGGELQRCCVARALRTNPQFIVADEMTTMLDAVTQAQVWEVLLRYCSEHKVGLVLVTHSKQLQERLATRVFEL